MSLAVAATGCDDTTPLVTAACREDTDCDDGKLCDNYECVAREQRACEVVIDGNPILQPAPHIVDFGEVETTAPLVQTVTIHNVGNCMLTLFQASLDKDATNFTCEFCASNFPLEIFPGRSVDVPIGYSPTSPQRSQAELVLLSDDKEYGTLRVPIKAAYSGTPALSASPSTLDFGFRPASGTTGAPKLVTITNQGSGETPITITSISLSADSAQDFVLQPTVELPRDLKPVRLDRNALISVELNYAPLLAAAHTGTLVIESNLGSMTVPITGTAEGPPHAAAAPTMIDFGLITLGRSELRTLTISNTEGGSPLLVSPSWSGVCDQSALDGGAAGINTDFAILPQTVPAVAPNGYTEVHVQATATVAPSASNPSGRTDAILSLATNDPSNPCIPVTLGFNSQLSAGGEVVKIDMTFDNGSDSAFDEDTRNVDLTLENPYGFICNKQNPAPTNWGNFGTASWLAFAPKEEPERIILSDALQDGTYRVQVNYVNDCKSLPTQLVASVLGISVEALLAYLTGGLTIPGGNVADVISQLCFSSGGNSTHDCE